MATRKNSTKGEQQVVDVVEVKGSNVSAVPSFLDSNQSMLTYVLIGVAALATIFAAYKYLYQGPREKEAVNAMYKAQQLFERDSFAVALESPSGAYEGFLSIIDQYGGTKSSNLAHYYAGVSYLNLGKYKEAVEYLDDYSPKDDVTAITAAGALGDAHAELGDKGKAMSYYTTASKTDNELLAPYYLHKLAMLSYSEGKKEDAIKQLQMIQEKYPDSQENREAEKLIARFQ